MPAAGRLGDKAQVLADGHGCPACPHSAIGPAVSGSANVVINNRSALRVGDTGIHAACCGPNTWIAVQGAPSVLINGKPAHRNGDANQHCGNIGKLVEGSTNVVIGDLSSRPQALVEPPAVHWVEWKIQDTEQNPLSGVHCLVKLSDGRVVKSMSDAQGMIRFDNLPAGSCELEIDDSEFLKR